MVYDQGFSGLCSLFYNTLSPTGKDSIKIFHS
jgi:hypothetical protein